MNKKTLRIAGWALGLSMAVAGIGATLATSLKSPIEAKAGEKEYELAYSFDCASASNGGTADKYGGKTTSMTKAYAKQFLNDAAGKTIVDSVDADPVKTYWAKGTGGPDGADDALKIGAASNAGSLSFTLSSTEVEISKAVVTAYGWKNTSKLNVNSVGATTLTSNTTLTEYPYVFKTKSRSISLSVTTSAVLATRIDLYAWKQTLSADIAEPYADETVTLSSDAENTVTWTKVNDGTTAEGATVNSATGEVTVSGAGNVKVKASAAGYVDKYYTITFVERAAGTYYDVTFNSDGGSESPAKKNIIEGGTFTLPSPGTKAHHDFLGWSSDGGSTKYATGATSPAVTGDVTYTAYWAEHAKYAVTYTAGTHGSGSKTTNEYVGAYTLQDLAGAGLTADDGYRLNHYDVVVGAADPVSKLPGEEITLTAATTITAVFEVIPTSFDIAYSGSSNGNMDETNQANSLFGLDDEKWSVIGYQAGHANLNVGLNSNTPKTIRLYANKDTGNGNILEIASLDSAVIIQNAVFNFGTTLGSYEVNKVIGSTSTKVTTTDDDDSDGITFAIQAPKMTIQNVNTGATTQVWIENISIEYDYVDSFKAAKAYEDTYVKQGISYTDNSETTNCLTAYGTAITQYAELSGETKIWFASRSEFANARARLIQWAKVNSKTLTFNPSTGAIDISPARIIPGNAIAMAEDSKVPLIITAITIGAVIAGGLFVLTRKRKEQ